MEKLNLSDNTIHDAGAIAIAKALKVNTTLAELSLSTPRPPVGNNKIGDEGGVAVGKALELSAVLNTLSLSKGGAMCRQERFEG